MRAADSGRQPEARRRLLLQAATGFWHLSFEGDCYCPRALFSQSMAILAASMVPSCQRRSQKE